MVTKGKGPAGKKKAKKGRVKTLNIKPETIKDLTGRDQKKIKGGGGLASSVLMGSNR